jgi:nitroreductase
MFRHQKWWKIPIIIYVHNQLMSIRDLMTNSVIETIKKRQSVRLYEQKPVPKDIINTIIEAGNLAPSTGDEKLVEEGGKKKKITNYQPWRFVVVENPEFKQQLRARQDTLDITRAHIGVLLTGIEA